MATFFPPLMSVPARCCEPGDVIYGRQGNYADTFLTFKFEVTVTAVTSAELIGRNANGNPFRMSLMGRTDVLVESKGN